MKWIIYILLYIWQLPQNIAGLAVLLFYKFKKSGIKKCGDGVYIVPYFCAGGVSLGNYIFILDSGNIEFAIKHEIGHRRQSMMLGPLYLLVVGIPSVVFNIISKYSYPFSKRYYQRFPENWANKLGKCHEREDD